MADELSVEEDNDVLLSVLLRSEQLQSRRIPARIRGANLCFFIILSFHHLSSWIDLVYHKTVENA